MFDPANYVNLNSLDLGNMQDASGRTYPILPSTPVTPINGNSPGVTISYDPTTGAPIVSPSGSGTTPMQNVSNPITDWLEKHFADWIKSHIPAHFGTRLIFVILGIGILLIVAFRLVK